MIQKIIAGILFSVFLFIAPGAQAEEAPQSSLKTPEQIINDVYNDIRVANELAQEAAKTLRVSDDREGKEVAIHLYVQAGKLYEKAHHVLSALGPEQVPQKDIDGSREAIENCVTAVTRIKEYL